MTTVINRRRDRAEDSWAGLMVSIVVFSIIIAAFFSYAIPAIRESRVNETSAAQKSNVDVDIAYPASAASVSR